MPNPPTLLPLDPIDRPSVAEQVYAQLREQIVTLALPPGTRMSEAEVAKALGTSRQPVRDAFFRLSQLGFLEIRPQRATTVSMISIDRVKEARFVRTALEVETIRVASETVTEAGMARLRDNIVQQAEAIRTDDRAQFHALDDAMHREICRISGHPFAWQTIRESKAHLDRVRLLSLSFNQETTFREHEGLVDALARRDPAACDALMRAHLSRLDEEIGRIRAENPAYFST